MNTKIFFLLSGLVVALCSLDVHGQHDNVWVVPDNSGVDFNSGSPVAISSMLRSRESCASICDKNGKLLFYTDGSFVWDQGHRLMPLGTNLTPFGPLGGTHSGTSSTSQGALIIPFPGDENKYYIFSLTSAEHDINMGRLYYSVVDMKANNGLGDIIPAQKALLLDTLLTEKMTAVVSDRCSIWLITCSQMPDFRAFEITESGINSTPVISPSANHPFLYFGQMNMSPDRKRLAVTQTSGSGVGYDGLYLYDFDPYSGLVSNPLQLLPSIDNVGFGAYGACFSPDNTKLYVNVKASGLFDPPTIVQFDLSTANLDSIIASKTHMGNSSLTGLKLGPDGIVYFFASNSVPWLSAIHFPNLKGIGAKYEDKAVSLPFTDISSGVLGLGLPAFVSVLRKDTLYTTNEVLGACFATSSTIGAKDSLGWDYTWQDGNTGFKRSAEVPGTYWCRYYTSPCVLHTDTFNVSFPDGMLPQLQTISSCKGLSNGKASLSTYSEDTVTYYYTWLSSDKDTLSVTESLFGAPGGIYSVHISTAFCDTVLSFDLSEEDYGLDFESDTLICITDTLVFHNTSDHHYQHYKWSFGDGQYSGSTSPLHVYTEPGRYEVMLAGAGVICQDTMRRHVTVDASFSLAFAPNRDSICVGEPLLFTSRTDYTMVELYWNFGDGGWLRTQRESVQWTYDTAGVMSIQLKGIFRACPDEMDTNTVHVFPVPYVDLGPDTVLCWNGMPLTLSEGKYQSPGYRYLWNTGATTPAIVVRHPGLFQLTVSSDHYCSTTETIVVLKDCYLDIPNAFTPNGDGVNDYFFPRKWLSHSITEFKLQVYNRWGQLVFETTSLEGNGWDGQFNGELQPLGVYVYKIEVVLRGQHRESYHGDLTLIR